MANIAVDFTPDPVYFPFAIPPGGVQPKTAIPRGRMSFFISDGTVALKVAGNTTSLKVTCSLPANFAYTFEFLAVDIAFNSSLVDAAHYEDNGHFVFFDGAGHGHRSSPLTSTGVHNESLNAGSAKIWSPSNVYHQPFYNTRGSVPSCEVALNDTHADETDEGDLSFVAAFLQYDISQVFEYPLNFPLPVTHSP